MMKKLFTLLFAGGVAVSATAQVKNNSSVVLEGGNYKVKEAVLPEVNTLKGFISPNTATKGAQKTTGNTTRWFSNIDKLLFLIGSTDPEADLDTRVQPIWFDSTAKQNFTSGLGNINFSSVSQVFDIVGTATRGVTAWHEMVEGDPNAMVVSSGNAYSIDSVKVRGLYVENVNRGTGVVDTLIVSVAATSGTYTFGRTASPWIADYTTDTSLRVGTPYHIDSINRAVLGSNGNTNRRFMKILLTDEMRTAAGVDTTFSLAIGNGIYGATGYTPTPLAMTANTDFSISMTFRSGDATYVPNQDTFTEYHHFMPVTTAQTGNTKMIYDPSDNINQSNMMFSTDTSRYLPSLAVEGSNPNSNFRSHYHDISAHVVCATCNSVSVKDVVNQNALYSNAYPNPAGAEVRIPFVLQGNGDVTVSLSNAIGQVVNTMTFVNAGKDEAVFNTSNLPSGVYIYTVETNGQRNTGRISVSH